MSWVVIGLGVVWNRIVFWKRWRGIFRRGLRIIRLAMQGIVFTDRVRKGERNKGCHSGSLAYLKAQLVLDYC